VAAVIDPEALGRFEDFVDRCMSDDIFTQEMNGYMKEMDEQLDAAHGPGESDRLAASFGEQILAMCPNITSMDNYRSVMLGVFLSMEFIRKMDAAAWTMLQQGAAIGTETLLKASMVQAAAPAMAVGIADLGAQVTKVREGAIITEELNENLSIEGDTPDD